MYLCQTLHCSVASSQNLLLEAGLKVTEGVQWNRWLCHFLRRLDDLDVRLLVAVADVLDACRGPVGVDECEISFVSFEVRKKKSLLN